jgi:hypothetical protein
LRDAFVLISPGGVVITSIGHSTCLASLGRRRIRNPLAAPNRSATSLDEYRHLWDGSESGWTLQRFDRIEWCITFHFSPSGPNKSEIAALRKLLDEFRNLPVSDVWQQLRGRSTFTLPREVGNIDMRELIDCARELGLNVTADSIDRGGYLPIHNDESALLIEDDEIAVQVAERMIAAGVPVTEVHVD